MRIKTKQNPAVKQLRKDVADFYRSVRKDNPKLARLLYKYSRECEKKLAAKLVEFIDGETT